MTATLPSALILAAGLGTRLRPLTTSRAKPSIPVAGTPLIRRIIRALVAQGVREVVVNLHHRPESIAGVLGDGDGLGCRLRYSWEPVVLGSAGGPRHALPLLGERFLVVNGDTWCDVALGPLLETHRERGAAVTLAGAVHPTPERYGGLLTDGDGWVRGVTRAGDTRPAWHFVGIQVAEARVFAPLEDGVPTASIGDLYDRLWDRPGRIALHEVGAAFLDIGTPADYLAASHAIGAVEDAPDTQVGLRCVVDPSARLDRSILWDDVVVGPGCVIRECILADRVRVPGGSRYERQAVVPWSPEAAGTPGATRQGDLLTASLDGGRP